VKIPVRYGITGANATAIATSVESAIREARLRPGSALPTVRELARSLAVSPTTVAAAYRTLRTRGLVRAEGRRGTRVSPRPPLPTHVPAIVPAHLRNLADGNPDPSLLPRLRPVPGRRPRLYGEATNRADLLEQAARQLADDGLPRGPLAVVGGALDGIERVLQAHLRAGDRVAVEDTGYTGVLDLLHALGLVAEPVALDDAGPLPDDLARALRIGVEACIMTPRAQNPSGAAIDARRARELRAVLAERPDVLLVEDDHAGPVAGVAAVTLCQRRRRWAVVRSVSKSLGPDLRLAILLGDATTVARVEGRQLLGPGWVSHLLQGIVAGLWADRTTEARLRHAAHVYGARRHAFLAALAERGIAARGRSGLNVWVPVPEETSMVSALAEAGWAVRAGERYRLKSPPAIRVTVATLEPGEADALAAAIARGLRAERRTASA